MRRTVAKTKQSRRPRPSRRPPRHSLPAGQVLPTPARAACREPPRADPKRRGATESRECVTHWATAVALEHDSSRWKSGVQTLGASGPGRIARIRAARLLPACPSVCRTVVMTKPLLRKAITASATASLASSGSWNAIRSASSAVRFFGGQPARAASSDSVLVAQFGRPSKQQRPRRTTSSIVSQPAPARTPAARVDRPRRCQATGA